MGRERKKVKNKITLINFRNKKLLFKILSLVIFIIFIFAFLYPQKSPNKQVAYLRIPKINQLYLPPPLELANISTNILGAQTIDPDDLVKYVNLERKKAGSPPLRISPVLMQGASLRADVILKYQNFSHQDPYENIELGTVLPRLNYHFAYASENIGMGGISAEDFVKGFMNSKSHKENLLNPALTDTGIAIVTGPYNQYYVNIAVQLFAIPAGKDEYLGYNQSEKDHYQKLINELNIKLNPLVWNLNKFVRSKNFSDASYNKLTKQKDILTKIYLPMKEGKPFTADHLALIKEYNDDLKLNL